MIEDRLKGAFEIGVMAAAGIALFAPAAAVAIGRAMWRKLAKGIEGRL